MGPLELCAADKAIEEIKYFIFGGDTGLYRCFYVIESRVG